MFRTVSNIYDGASLRKCQLRKSVNHIFLKKLHHGYFKGSSMSPRLSFHSLFISHIILNSHIKLNPFFNKFTLKKLLIEPSGQKHQFIIILTV